MRVDLSGAAAMTLLSYALLGALVLVVFGLRMRRMMQIRPLNLRSLWVLPVIVLGVLALSLKSHPPQGAGWLWMLGAFVVGSLLGWLRAKTIRLTRDQVTGEVMAQGSAIAIVFLLALLGGRILLRGYLTTQAAAHPATPGSVDAAFLALAFGLFAMRAIEMTLRARTLAGPQIAS